MCGCQTKTPKSKGNNTMLKFNEANVNMVEHSVNRPKINVSKACDSFGQNCEKVTAIAFNTSEQAVTGGAINLSRTTATLTGFPKDAFSVSMNTSTLTAIGLRQMAEVLNHAANELDGGALVMPPLFSNTATKAKKAKGKKKVKKKATKKAA